MQKSTFKRFDALYIATIALLVALQIVLSRFLSIPTPITKIGFSFVPLVISARKYGVIDTAIVAFISDILGAILFPQGTFFPGYTLTAVMFGVTFGLFLHYSDNIIAIVSSVIINQFGFSLFLNTLWIQIQSTTPYHVLLGTRVWQSLVMTVVQIVVIIIIVKKGGKVLNSPKFM
ncbi:MAG: folate family ECF transporter S component [Clostridia bacterium]|nr:folate family ECF transporter S component [Clostridia bacterium]